MASAYARAMVCVLAVVAAGMLPGARTRPVAQAQVTLDVGGPFALIDQHGQPFSSEALAGLPYAIFFGFTNCPDVCPTTLLEMSHHLSALGPDGDRLKVVFVTVDPERDTPDQLRAYLSSFDPRIVGLTGTPDRVADAAKVWKAFHNKIPEDGGGYTVVHSAYVYLMDTSNRCVGTMGFQDAEAEQLAKLRVLLRGAADTGK